MEDLNTKNASNMPQSDSLNPQVDSSETDNQPVTTAPDSATHQGEVQESLVIGPRRTSRTKTGKLTP